MDVPLTLLDIIKREEECLEIKDELTTIEEEFIDIDDDEITVINVKPPEIITKTVELNIDGLNKLPKRTKAKYLAAYNKFMDWRNANSFTTYSEDVLLTYFNELSKTYKPPSLKVYYSMLSATLTKTDEFDLKKYTKLIAFLKDKANGFKNRLYKTLTLEDINKFINKAPDEEHLATKVVYIFGIIGACSAKDLLDLKIDDVSEYDSSMFVVRLPNKIISRSFSITGKFYKLVRKYIASRPDVLDSDRFFLNFRNDKCIAQPIGPKQMNSMSKSIAFYLRLPDPERYAGYRFQHPVVASLVCNEGALKRKREQKSKSFDGHDYGDDDYNNEQIEYLDDNDDSDDDYQLQYAGDSDDSDDEISRKTKKRIDERIAQSSLLNQEDGTNLSIRSESISCNGDNFNNDLSETLLNQRIAKNSPNNHLGDPFTHEKVNEKSKERNSDHLVEDPASDVRKTPDEKEDVCDPVSENEHTTLNEQNIESCTEMKIPHERVNLKIVNCQHFTLNFYGK